MPVTTSLTTQIGQVRLELGDTNTATGQGVKPDGTNLTDAEIQVWLTRATGMTSDTTQQVLLATMYACQALARHWSRAADIALPTRKESLSQVAAGWAKRAKEIGAEVGSGLRIRPLARPQQISGGSEWS